MIYLPCQTLAMKKTPYLMIMMSQNMIHVVQALIQKNVLHISQQMKKVIGNYYNDYIMYISHIASGNRICDEPIDNSTNTDTEKSDDR